MHTSSSTSSPSPSQTKRRFACGQCDRTFTTGGHLARHTRVHTGERNHRCPFPGCETRCSRQDNLQQHYRIHLSPGSRRTSGAATRAAMNKQAGLNIHDGASSRTKSRTRSRTPPPPLVSAVSVSDGPASPITRPDPPNTPPPLVNAYGSHPPGSVSSQSSARSTPELQYAYTSPTAHTLHPSSRVSHSPETTYSPTQPHASGQQSYWNHHRYEPKSEYPYGYSDETTSPSSSPNNQYSSPQSPYATSSKYDNTGRPSRHTMNQAAASPVDPISPTAAHPPTPSYSSSSSYGQSYGQGVPAAPPLTQHDSTSSVGSAYSSIANYSGGARSGHSDSTSPSAPQLAYPQSSYYSQPSSQARYPSPPVVLAPIQTDRLARGSEQLPTLSSTTSASSSQYQSVPSHHQSASSAPHVGNVQRSNSVPQLEVAHYTHAQQQHAPSHPSSYAQYSYSNISSTNSAGGWRPDNFRRNSIQAV